MMCQIIIIVWNQLKITKACLETVIRKTKTAFEIILIDNASDDETAAFLKKFSLEHKDRVVLIVNEKNLGFIKAANQGLKYSKADFVCLLNNDTLVTEGWLEELIFVASRNPEIGLLNPSSNTLGQKVVLGRIDEFAASCAKYHGKFEEMTQVSGFCMLIRREVILRIGLLDEIYGMGYFEDTDYSRRAVAAGFGCARALASYVYHRERTSFLKLKGNNAAFVKNQQIFYRRWGSSKRIFIEAKNGLSLQQIDKIISLAKNNHWIFIAKKTGSNLSLPKHPNIKEFAFKNSVFEMRCFLKVMKKIKKRYDYIFAQSPFVENILCILKIFHKAQVVSFRELEGYKIDGR